MQTRSRDVVILAFDDVDLLDIAAPLEVLTTAGRNWNWRPFRIHLAAPTPTVRTTTDLVLHATVTLEACPSSEVLIVPGGYGAERLADDEEVIEWLRARAPTQAHLGCLGEGALLLGRAGALGSDPVAAPPRAHALLRERAPVTPLHAGASYYGERVLSARTGSGGTGIGLALVARLLSPRIAASVAAELDLPWTDDTGKVSVPQVIIRESGSSEEG